MVGRQEVAGARPLTAVVPRGPRGPVELRTAQETGRRFPHYGRLDARPRPTAARPPPDRPLRRPEGTDMAEHRAPHATGQITIDAPPDAVYRLVGDPRAMV